MQLDKVGCADKTLDDLATLVHQKGVRHAPRRNQNEFP
jgi:hypothetical protein